MRQLVTAVLASVVVGVMGCDKTDRVMCAHTGWSCPNCGYVMVRWTAYSDAITVERVNVDTLRLCGNDGDTTILVLDSVFTVTKIDERAFERIDTTWVRP